MTSTRVVSFPPVPLSSKICGECRLGDKSGSSTNLGCRAICYDEAVYPAPQTYDPERFLKGGVLDSSVKDPEERIFGSGRRYVTDFVSYT
jgi:hypothetical protein